MRRHGGFTLTETLIVTGILAVLFSIGYVGLLRVQRRPQLTSTGTKLIADIKEQQLKAMVGVADDTLKRNPYGIHFDTSRYILFRGYSYPSTNSAAFNVDLDATLTIDTSFPGRNLIFDKGSGQVIGYTPGHDSVSVTQVDNGDTFLIQVNPLGTVVSGP